MAKSTKAPKQAQPDPWEAASAAALRVISAEIAAIEANNAPCDKCGQPSALPGTQSRGDRAAALAAKASSIAAELRKARNAGLKQLNAGLVEQWLRLQTPEYRAGLVRELVEMDSLTKRSVIG